MDETRTHDPVGPTGQAGPTGPTDEIAARLDALTDLFRRRLVADQNTKAAVTALHEQLDRSAALVESAFLTPLARRLFSVIDRMDGAGGELAASVAEELADILTGHGIEEIRVADDRFDPAAQQALTAIATADPDRDGTVAARVRRGWRAGPRVLRPELVEVYRCAGNAGTAGTASQG